MIRKQRRPLARHLIDRLLFRPPKLDAGDASERGIVELLALVHHDSGKQDSLSALGLAAAVGYPDMVQALLDAGTNHALRAMEGSTALLISLRGGFMGREADVNVQDHEGKTALAHATEGGHDTVVALLKEAEANE